MGLLDDMAAQPDLPWDGELPEEERGVFLPALMGDYTGEKLAASKPELYSVAVRLLARGVGIRGTAQITGLAARSVMAIRRRETSAIATHKQALAADSMEVSALALDVARERLIEDPDSVSFRDAMVGAGIAVDKGLLLAGEASMRIEHVHRDDGDDWELMLRRARERGQVIDVEAEAEDMGIEGSGGGAKGEGSGGPAGGSGEGGEGVR
jgi:hypothetical protein